MKPEWDEALAAFDAKIDVLEGLRNDYIAFLRGSFESLGHRLLEERGKLWTGDFYPKSDAMTPDVSWVARPRAGSPVGCHLWASGPNEGPKGMLRMALAIDLEPGYAKGEADERKTRWSQLAALVRDGVPALPGLVRVAAHHPDTADECVWIHTIPLPEAATDATFDAFARFAEVAAKVDDIIQLCTWLGDSLVPLTKSTPPAGWVGARWEAEALKPWEGGWYVQVEQPDGDDDIVWVAARPPGELVLGHTRTAVHEELCRELGASNLQIDVYQPYRHHRYAVVLDKERAREWWQANNVAAARKQVLRALQVFFRLDSVGKRL